MTYRKTYLIKSLSGYRIADSYIHEHTDLAKSIEMFSTIFNIPLAKLIGKNRSRKYVWPRHIACSVLRAYTIHSLKDIGKEMGGRDHTTVIHSCQTAEDLCGQDRAFQEMYKHGELNFLWGVETVKSEEVDFKKVAEAANRRDRMLERQLERQRVMPQEKKKKPAAPFKPFVRQKADHTNVSYLDQIEQQYKNL